MNVGRGAVLGRSNAQRGLSLMELMAAMTVIAITIFGVISMMTQTMTTRQSMREMEIAKEWTLKRIEDVKSQKFNSLKGATIYPVNFTSGTTQQFVGVFGVNSQHLGTNPAGVPNTTEVGPPMALYNPVPTNAPLVLPDGSTLPLGTFLPYGTLTIDYTNPNLYEIVCTLTWKGVKGTGNYSMRSLMSP